MADVHDSLFDSVGDTVKKHTLKSPIGEIEQVLVSRSRVREHIAKQIAQKIGFHTAELAGEEVVGFLQSCRGPALGALGLNE